MEIEEGDIGTNNCLDRVKELYRCSDGRAAREGEGEGAGEGEAA
jgi:hypothetical protein